MSFNFKRVKHFTKLPPLKVGKPEEGSKQYEQEGGRETDSLSATLQCANCEKVTIVEGESKLDFVRSETGRFSLMVAKELFGGGHDLHCVLDAHLGKIKPFSSTALSDLQGGMMQARKLFKTVVPSAVVFAGVLDPQLYRCKLSRLNAIKRKLRWYVRKGQILPSSRRIASILFNDRENSTVSHSQVIISEAIRRAIPNGVGEVQFGEIEAEKVR